ncbi:MAG: PAS domain S-box protein, partial [Jatrophihabitantaceae bacterium]
MSTGRPGPPTSSLTEPDAAAGGTVGGWSAPQLLAAIVQSSQDAIIGKSRTGNILSWNPGAERLYGWSAGQTIGQHINLLVPEDQRELEQQLFSRILAGERLEAFELSRLHRDGHRLEVSLSMSPVLDPAGHIVGVSSSSRDVGELQRARRGFQRILDAEPDAIVCVNANGEITFANVAVETLFQYRPAELTGLPVEVLLPESNRVSHIAMRTRYRQHPTARTMGTGRQLYGLRRDGSSFPADISLAPIDDSSDGSTVAAVRDATTRYAIEASVRESEQRFRQVTESVEAGFTLRSLSSDEFLYVSPGYLRILGLGQDVAAERGPKQVRNLIHPDDRGELAEDYFRRVEAGEPAQLELRIVRPDGAVRWIRATSTPVPEPDGQVDRVAGTLEDITDRRSAEV